MKKPKSTKEEIREQWRKRSALYYISHKEAVKKRNLKHYHKMKKLTTGELPFSSSLSQGQKNALLEEIRNNSANQRPMTDEELKDEAKQLLKRIKKL